MNNSVYYSMVMIVLLPHILAAQSSSPDSPKKDFMVDCTVVQAGASCRSYNELIKAKDKGLLDQLQYDPYVCFLQESDEFLVLTTKRPPPESFRLDTNNVSKASSVENIVRFKNGLNDDFRFVIGSWTKITPTDPPQYVFDSLPTSDTAYSIDDSEISANYKFTNLSMSTTTLTFKVRRSTKRFVETYEFLDEPPPAKKGEQHSNKKTTSQFSFTGYCANFN